MTIDSASSLSGLAPLQAVLFDVDGTLCDSDPIHYYAFREMLQEIGFNGGVPITEDYFVENLAGKHNEDTATLLFPDDHERGVKFFDDKEAMFRNASSLSGLAPLQAVLFDVDGTLCDSDPIHYYAFREMLQEIGFNGGVPITEDYFVENIAGKHNEDIATLLFPDDHERGVKFLDDKETMFRKLAKDQLKPIDGLYKLTQWIEDHGLKRGAVTNAPKPNADLMISLLGLTDFFQCVVVGSECEHAKPFPDPYLKALEILKVSKDHTFVCEDSVSGITAGVEAGMPTIGLTTRNPELQLMKANPTFLIKNYEDPKLWAALEALDKMTGVA